MKETKLKKSKLVGDEIKLLPGKVYEPKPDKLTLRAGHENALI